MIPLGTESPWGFNYSFNPLIDFCVSVLEFDGLYVGPFSQHQEGSGTLRSRGLDVESWRSWLANVVATQDARLNWHIEDLRSSLSKDVASFRHVRNIN
ncbi:hypothetical protein [aff. Roholtiella sp. LEGE 12411]|uniref:hypothetical protein n=1 Tax=aff. Roholtiella sp. LEGE 12411 TaxID=1828822 RepID=UPI001A079E29|nr:hypothetical protein [aff. Roholtiella sp. LEGE 12411]